MCNVIYIPWPIIYSCFDHDDFRLFIHLAWKYVEQVTSNINKRIKLEIYFYIWLKGIYIIKPNAVWIASLPRNRLCITKTEFIFNHCNITFQTHGGLFLLNLGFAFPDYFELDHPRCCLDCKLDTLVFRLVFCLFFLRILLHGLRLRQDLMNLIYG